MQALAAVALLTLASAGDYELVTVPAAPEPICTKSYETCNEAARAVRDFGLFRDMGITKMLCLPHPGCFPPDSNTIKGYNRR
jgi:hypothetical protein